MTVATVIYYSGYHPYTMQPTYVAKTEKEKKNQHMFFFWHKKEYQQRIKDKLLNKGRGDLVGRLLGHLFDKKEDKGKKDRSFDKKRRSRR